MENYYLKFFLKNRANPFIYQVPKEEAKKVKKCLLNSEIVTRGGFIGFDVIPGRIVKIKISSIQLCQVLWDYGINSISDEHSYNLLFVLEGIEEPIVYCGDDTEEIAEIIEELDKLEWRDREETEFFVEVTDEDGETNLIKANDIMLVETANFYLDEDEGEEND